LLLTAKVEVDDRVAGLDAGADDYLVKPFAIAELSARVRALLRRNAVPESGADVTVGSISLNRDTRNVERNGRRIELTKTEFNLLELLADQAGLVVSRETIYENVWGYNFETNSKSTTNQTRFAPCAVWAIAWSHDEIPHQIGTRDERLGAGLGDADLGSDLSSSR
jgi:DNA-binding response OmpR family regulator